MPWTCRCWSAMNTHHITILQARSVRKISMVCLFTHLLRIITHPFTSWGGSFLTIYTQASVPGRYHWSCSENIWKSWWWTQHLIKTNRFRLPLFNICGSTFSNASLSVASAFLSSKDKESVNENGVPWWHEYYCFQGTPFSLTLSYYIVTIH
jgi:hypothetical protein